MNARDPVSSETVSARRPPRWKAEPRGDGWHILAATGPFKRIATVHAMKRTEADLFTAAPELLDLARQYAKECGDCAGTRVVPDGNGGDERCVECAHIWVVIDRAEGR